MRQNHNNTRDRNLVSTKVGIIRLLIIALIFLACPGIIWLNDEIDQRSVLSLTSLRAGDVSEVMIFDSLGSARSMLLSLDSNTDGEKINQLVTAFHHATYYEPSREDIGPRDLLMIISLSNGKSIELDLHKNKSCARTIIIDIIRQIGPLSTLYLGSAESDIDLDQWFQATNLRSELGC
jgi:hypothetical protein